MPGLSAGGHSGAQAFAAEGGRKGRVALLQGCVQSVLAPSINDAAIRLLNRIRRPDQLVIYPTTNSGYGTQSGELFCTEETPPNPSRTVSA